MTTTNELIPQLRLDPLTVSLWMCSLAMPNPTAPVRLEGELADLAVACVEEWPPTIAA